MTSDPVYREVFRNKYVTGFSVGAWLWMIGGLVVGVVFSAGLLLIAVYCALRALYMVLGIDLLDFKAEAAADPPSVGGFLGGLAAFIVWLCFFLYLGPHSLIRFQRRLYSRWYVLSGRPLASLEGRPRFDPSSESGYIGLEIGDFYFKFDDCWLDADDETLAKLDGRGVLRAWYVTTGTRTWTNPTTGKQVNYDCTLVRGEWRAGN